MAGQVDVPVLRRAAKVEALRRDFPRFFEQQLQIRPREGPILRAPLKFTQQLVDKVIQDQLRETGWIRLVEFKARQHGGSTHGVARACHRVYLNENVSALIIAQDDSTTASLFDMAQLFYESLDVDIRPVRRYLNMQKIVLENPDPKTRPEYPGLRSRIEIQSAKNMHAAVGTMRNWLHLSEFCRFGRVQELKGSLLPSVPDLPGTAIIIESAPFGYGEGREEFRAWCEAARSGKSPYKFVGIYWWMDTHCTTALLKGEKIKWTMEEKRVARHVAKIAKAELGREWELTDEQIKFRRGKIQSFGQGDDAIGEQLFFQQFPGDYAQGWVTMDLGVFDHYKLEQMASSGMIRGPLRQADVIHDHVETVHPGPLWIWEEPQAGEIYDLGADVASGNITGATRGDYSAFQIIKRRTKEQVAEYQNWINPLQYAELLDVVGRYYNLAHVGVEMEGIGYATGSALVQLGYGNLYQWRSHQHMFTKLSTYTGWKTQTDSKKLLIAVGQGLTETWGSTEPEAIIHSHRLMAEMKRYIRAYTDSGKEQYFASEGHDDLITSWMIAQVISRDESAMSLPPDLGPSPDSDISLAARNRRMAAAIANQNGMYDYPDQLATRGDAFERLAKAMRSED